MRRESESQLKPPALAPVWMVQPERSRPALIRAFAWIALRFGRRLARVLLHPVTLYFVLFSTRAKAASCKYLQKALGREPRFADVYRHYHTFASTILDRVYLLNGEYGRFDVRTFNEEIVLGMVARGEGGFLLGAHVGSFEVIRALGRQARGLNVRMVMYEENSKKVNDVFEAINPGSALEIIPLGRVDSMLRLERTLAQGGFVGMLADRTIIAGEGTVPVSFLGSPAHVPAGPFRIAAIMKRPVIIMFGLYRGGNRYDIHFEHLVDLRDVSRATREAVIDEAVRNYVGRLEHYCRLAPHNWFNFYDFWR